MYERCHCSRELPKSGQEIDSEVKKKKVKKKTLAVWEHVLFGLGGSGTRRNVKSSSEQQRNISFSGGCF